MITKPPMRITLSRPAEKYVRERARAEHYHTAGEYVDDLIRDDQKRLQAGKRLEALLLEGIHSGSGIVMGSKEWKKFRGDILSRVGREKYEKNPQGRFPEDS